VDHFPTDALMRVEDVGLDGAQEQAVARHPGDTLGQLEPPHDPTACAGLLPDFADRRGFEGLAGLHPAAREDPEPAVGSVMLDQQDPAAPRDDHSDPRRLAGHGAGGASSQSVARCGAAIPKCL
jgi:hypothetical protein